MPFIGRAGRQPVNREVAGADQGQLCPSQASGKLSSGAKFQAKKGSHLSSATVGRTAR